MGWKLLWKFVKNKLKKTCICLKFDCLWKNSYWHYVIF